MQSMHEYTQENSNALAEAVVEYTRRRLADPQPLDHPVPPDESARAAGPTVTSGGIGGQEALRIWGGMCSRPPASRPITRSTSRSFPRRPPRPRPPSTSWCRRAQCTGARGSRAPARCSPRTRRCAWLAAEFGLPAEAGGVFVQGGTLGNLSALVAAREHARAGHAEPLPARWKIVCSAEAHSSIASAARVMDVDVVAVEPNDDGRLDGGRGRAALEEHGSAVFAVVATGGLHELRHRRRPRLDRRASRPSSSVWLHVDGAYGAAALSRRAFGPSSEVEAATRDRRSAQVALRPVRRVCAHLPRPDRARAAHTQHAEYLDTLTETAEWNPSDSPITSPGARAGCRSGSRSRPTGRTPTARRSSGCCRLPGRRPTRSAAVPSSSWSSSPSCPWCCSAGSDGDRTTTRPGGDGRSRSRSGSSSRRPWRARGRPAVLRQPTDDDRARPRDPRRGRVSDVRAVLLDLYDTLPGPSGRRCAPSSRIGSGSARPTSCARSPPRGRLGASERTAPPRATSRPSWTPRGIPADAELVHELNETRVKAFAENGVHLWERLDPDPARAPRTRVPHGDREQLRPLDPADRGRARARAGGGRGRAVVRGRRGQARPPGSTRRRSTRWTRDPRRPSSSTTRPRTATARRRSASGRS